MKSKRRHYAIPKEPLLPDEEDNAAPEPTSPDNEDDSIGNRKPAQDTKGKSPAQRAADSAAEDANSPGEMPGNARSKPRSEKSVNAIVAQMSTVETTTRDSPYYTDSFKKPYNPDDLVQRRMDYSIYDRDMFNDDQVNVCLELKKDLVLGSGYEFVCEDDEQAEDPEEIDPNAPPALPNKKPFAFPPKSGQEPTDPATDDPEHDPEDLQAAEGDAAGEDDLDDVIKKDLEIAFGEDPEIDIEQSFAEMLSAYEIGFSLTEKTWKQRDDGSITLKFLKTRHPSTWLIHQDEMGNVERFEQRQGKKSVDVKPTSLIHYVNNPRYQNPYGRSDLRSCYDAWFIKREIIKYYAIFLEKAASPTPVARYDKNAPPEAVTEIYNAIKKFQTKTALAIPKEIELEFLEAKSDGEAYVKGINIFNMFIGRSLMIPDLMGFQGGETGGGSHQLGDSQMKVLIKHILRRRSTFEKLVNSQLVKPFVYYNYGFVEKFPKFRLKEISDENVEKFARLWLEAMKGKLYKPSDEEINFFRKSIKFPVGPVEQEPPPMPSPTLPDGSPNPAHPEIAAGKTPEEIQADKAKENGDPENLPPFPGVKAAPSGAEKKPFGGPGSGPRPGGGGTVHDINERKTGPSYADKGGKGGVTVSTTSGQIKLKTPKTLDEASAQVGVMNEIHAAASADFERSRSLPEGDPERVHAGLRMRHVDQQLGRAAANASKLLGAAKGKYAKAFESPPGDYSRKTNFKLLKAGLDNGLAKILDEGKPLIREIYEDLFKQIRDKKILQAQDLSKIDRLKVKKLPALRSLLRKRFTDLYSDAGKQAVAELQKGVKKKFAAPLADEDFMEFLDAETWAYIGDWEYNVKKKIRVAMSEAIKDGNSLSDLLAVLDDEGIALSEVSLERYARTKLTEVMNRARKSAFEETGVVAAYQFTAIMDDRVSDICAGLHGAIFDKDDAPVPPLHFNCRSALIPITKYEDYDVTKSVDGTNINSFIDDNIGEGFSRQ